MSKTNQVCITCTQRDTCQYYDQNRTICVPAMTEQEMQFELMKSQEKVNELRQEVAAMNKEQEYWQQVRIDAAIAAMQAELSNPNNTFMMCEDKDAIIAKRSVRRADTLVAELKRSDDVYAEFRRMDAINTASVCENMTKIQKELQKKGGRNDSNND